MPAWICMMAWGRHGAMPLNGGVVTTQWCTAVVEWCNGERVLVLVNNWPGLAMASVPHLQGLGVGHQLLGARVLHLGKGGIEQSTSTPCNNVPHHTLELRTVAHPTLPYPTTP